MVDDWVQESAPSPRIAARNRGVEIALVTAVISGVAVYINGQAVRQFESATVYTTGKNLVAGVLLLALAAATTPRRARTRPGPVAPERRRDRRVSVLESIGVALFGGGVAFVLFFEGLARATSTDAAFIHKTMVVWVAGLAVLILREQIGTLQVAAVALLVAGHAMIFGGVGSLRFGTGEWMILAATLLWSSEVVVVKRLLGEIRPAVMGSIRVAGGAAFLVVWLAITGRAASLVTLNGSQIGWLLVTGTVLTCFVTCWYHALRWASAVDVTAILVLGAVVTGTLDVVVGDAPVGARLPGWVLITVGVAIVAGASARFAAGGPRVRSADRLHRVAAD